MKKLILILTILAISIAGFSQTYQEQYAKAKTDHREINKVDSLTVRLHTQQTQRRGLRISNEFTISHAGGTEKSAYNLYLEQALKNLEAEIIAEVLRISREKKLELKPLALEEAKENVVKLEGEIDG